MWNSRDAHAAIREHSRLTSLVGHKYVTRSVRVGLHECKSEEEMSWVIMALAPRASSFHSNSIESEKGS